MSEYLQHSNSHYYGENREHKNIDNSLSPPLRRAERRRNLGCYEELNGKQGQVDVKSQLIQ